MLSAGKTGFQSRSTQLVGRPIRRAGLVGRLIEYLYQY